MAALSTVVIGKVDSIHRTFTKDRPALAKASQNNNSNSSSNNNNSGKQEQNSDTPGPRNSQGGPAGPPAPPAPTLPKSSSTVAKNGKPTKQTNPPPPPLTSGTKSMIEHCSNEKKDDTLNLLLLRNTIKSDLIAAKAPENLQVTVISGNHKDNMPLYTHRGFQNIDFELHQGTIIEARPPHP